MCFTSGDAQKGEYFFFSGMRGKLFTGYMPRGGGGGVLGISSDGDDRRTFFGLKFSIPGLFWVRKFGKYFLA